MNLDDQNWDKEDDDYYVHIDVLHGSSKIVTRAINKFMILSDSYDPRRAFNFPTDLMDSDQKNKDTLEIRRELACEGSDSYYELWKVRKHFSIKEFKQMVNNIEIQNVERMVDQKRTEVMEQVSVRLVKVIDDCHEIFIFDVLF
jgi:hypothetical protein